MTIEVDRSRIIAYQRCPRERFLAYHAGPGGKGLQRKAKSLPLQVGSAFHAGAECLLEGDIETACYRAIKYLVDAFKDKGVGFDGEEATDASLVYSAQEQVALAEGLIRAWGLERLPEFLSTFEVIEVEKEGRATLSAHPEQTCGNCEASVHAGGSYCPRCGHAINSEWRTIDDLVLMFRPDALVRERLSGDYYIISWKTASTYTKRTLNQCRTDHQSISEVWGRENEQCEDEGCDHHGTSHGCNNPKIEGVVYQFVVKGRRSKDDWDGLYKQGSHLIYGWVKLETLKDEFPEWSWCYQWQKEDGSGISKLGRGWKKMPIWSDYPGGVKAWIEDLHNRKVFPRHLDPFESVFPQSLPVERRADEVERWKRQVVAQELRVAESLREVEICQGIEAFNGDHALDIHFPQHTGACFQFSGCSFIPICHEGIAAEDNELYTIRTANHPESEDNDD